VCVRVSVCVSGTNKVELLFFFMLPEGGGCGWGRGACLECSSVAKLHIRFVIPSGQHTHRHKL